MKTKDIVAIRLQNQFLFANSVTTPEIVVAHFGAVQAQDYLGSLWAIGQRMKKASEAAVEKALSDRTIVRSWPLRGTLHYVSPKDIRWMLKLLAPRVLVRANPIYRQAGLNNAIISKSRKIIINAMKGNGEMMRSEIYALLEKSKISTDQQRGLHILGNMALEQVVCFGPRRGKQQTFVLLDEWIPATQELSHEESLSKLCLRYFRSHGPATLQDFSWWSGLAPTNTKLAFELCKSNLSNIKIDERQYWWTQTKPTKIRRDNIALLPSYDEYTVAYKDRSLVLDAAHTVITRNGIFSPIIIIDGEVSGTWGRTFSKNGVDVELKCFKKLTATQHDIITSKVNAYCNFLERPLTELKIRLLK